MGKRLVLVLAAPIVLAGCMPDNDTGTDPELPSEDGRGGLPADMSQGLLSGTIPLEWGFVDGEWRAGWNIGDSRDQENLATDSISEVYVFCRDSEFESCPMEAPRRGDNIFATVPKDGAYSPFWQVVRVRVPDDYIDNTIKSEELLLESGWEIERLPMVVNCPIHEPFATLEDGAAIRNNLGWYQGYNVEYWDFGFVPLSEGVVETRLGYALYRDDEPLSEIALEQDMNMDGDQGGTNNILSLTSTDASARIELRRADVEPSAVTTLDVEDPNDADFTSLESLDDPSVTKGESIAFLNFGLKP